MEQLERDDVRVRKLWIPSAVVLAAFTTVPAAAEATAADGCPRGGRLVVNADLTYSNSLDTGDDGHAWALDAARERMQIWEIGMNTYCLKRQDTGTFRTFAGVSPAGSGMVREGVTGRFHA